MESKANKVSSNISGTFNKASSGIGKVVKALSIGALVAGLASFGKSALDAASDLQEWQNVVDVAFAGATKDVEQFYKICASRFGLSQIAARKLLGTFKAMANGVGLTEAAGRKMSIQLSGLAADMASFFNTDYKTTANALEGIFTGQTRALKQFGIVMNDANLEAFRLSRGIQTAYSDMNTAQKVALRYNYVLATTANAQNDFARTSMSWANQMRLLANNWATLTSTVGAQLIGLLTPVVAILNKILSLAISVVNAIAKIFGGKGISSLTTSFGDAGDAAGAIADNIGDVGDGLGSADKAAKKFKATIAGFDELEVLNPQPSDSGGGGGGSGGGGGGSPGAEDIGSYFDLYDEEGILNNFEDFFQKIKDMMDADNWEGIGAEIGKGLNIVFKAVDDWITNVFEPFGVKWAGRIARVLNGLVDSVDWNLIGKTFADGLNAYIHIANEFYEKFNALNFAVGIATAINSWFTNVDWEGIGLYLANKLNFLGDILYGFATTIDWEKIKESISRAISSLFENLDVDKIKTSIGKLVNDFMDFLKSVDWYQLGYTLGEMLSEVDWLGILKGVYNEVLWPAVKGFWDGLMSDGKNYILGWIGKISSWFKTNFFGVLAALIAPMVIKLGWDIFKKDIWLGTMRGFFFGKDAEGAALTGAQSFFQSIKYIFTNRLKDLGEIIGTSLGFGDMFKGVASWVGNIAGPFAAITAVVLSLTSAYGGLGGVLERVKKVFTDAWDIIKKFYEASEIANAIAYLKEQFGRLKDALKGIYDALAPLKPMWELVFDAISVAMGVIGSIITTVMALLAGFIGALVDVAATIINVFVDPITAIATLIGNFCQEVIDFFAGLKYALIGDPIIIDMWEGIKKVFKDAIDKVLKFVKDLVDKVIKFFTNLWDKAVEIYNKLKDFLSKTWEAIKTKTTDVWNSIKQWLSETWNAILQTITTVWNGIQEITTVVWTAISGFITTIWEGIKTAISTAIEWVRTTISTIWTSISETTSSTWNTIKTTISGVWDGIKTKAESITNSIKNFFTNAYNSIKEKWDGFGSWFRGIFSGIDGIVRSALNGVIRIMNSLSVTVPDWVPKIGGRTFGFNIPYLAKGGIIDSPTIAMMGEYVGARSNPEIVAPQSMIREIISEENGEMVSALYQIAKQIISAIDDVDLSVSIGDDQIGNAANRANNAYKKRTGRPLFSM